MSQRGLIYTYQTLSRRYERTNPLSTTLVRVNKWQRTDPSHFVGMDYFEPGPNCANASRASAMVRVAPHSETSNTGSDAVGTRNDCGFADDDRWRSAKTRYVVPCWNLKL